jgi:hypothetical protein
MIDLTATTSLLGVVDDITKTKMKLTTKTPHKVFKTAEAVVMQGVEKIKQIPPEVIAEKTISATGINPQSAGAALLCSNLAQRSFRKGNIGKGIVYTLHSFMHVSFSLIKLFMNPMQKQLCKLTQMGIM